MRCSLDSMRSFRDWLVPLLTRGRVYVTVWCPSVCPPVYPSCRPLQQRDAGLLLWLEISIDCCTYMVRLGSADVLLIVLLTSSFTARLIGARAGSQLIKAVLNSDIENFKFVFYVSTLEWTVYVIRVLAGQCWPC